MSVATCGVCFEEPSKYKCPHCELRYCSIKCFKIHIETHEASSTQPTVELVERKDARPEGVNVEAVQDDEEAPPNPYLTFQNHPQFQPLFTKYPQLKSQLQRIYQVTQNPYDRPSGEHEEGGAIPRPRYRDRVQGQWTQEKADEMATKVLMDLRKEDEGVKEFMALVNRVFRRDTTGSQAEGEVG